MIAKQSSLRFLNIAYWVFSLGFNLYWPALFHALRSQPDLGVLLAFELLFVLAGVILTWKTFSNYRANNEQRLRYYLVSALITGLCTVYSLVWLIAFGGIWIGVMLGLKD